MAGVPVKFRCYQCNRLLGVSQSKIGSIVACPKCGAGLVVPSPTEEGEATTVATGPSGPFEPPPPPPAAPDSTEGGISFDFLDIRPEDIRVEPGVERLPYTPPPREAPPPAEEPPIVVREPTPPPQPPVPAAPAPTARPIVSPAVTEEPSEDLIPPIRLDAPRPAPARTLPLRSRDVVLPRSAVASWSLFVLLALGLAFLAGLLAGHFLWRVH